MRRSTRALLAMSLVAGSVLVASGPALGECTDNRANRWPAFEEVAPTAKRVVVGTVTEISPVRGPDGPATWFLLEVEDVLKGAALSIVEVNGLHSGLPLRGEQTCRETSGLYVRPGDKLAIAFDGKLKGTKGRVNSATWLEGNMVLNPGLGEMGLDEVRELVGLEPLLPDTVPDVDASPAPSPEADPLDARSTEAEQTATELPD